jgi:hypothetical protein
VGVLSESHFMSVSETVSDHLALSYRLNIKLFIENNLLSSQLLFRRLVCSSHFRRLLSNVLEYLEVDYQEVDCQEDLESD